MEEKLPQVEFEGEAWYRAVPPPAIPMPAVHMPPDLHGERAIISDPDVGTLYDVRVLGSVHRDAAGAWANIVPELEYWRAKIHPERPIYPRRVPLEHVYIEHRLPYEAPEAGQLPPPPPDASTPAYLLRRLAPSPDQPGARTPVPARAVGNLHGRRIIQTNPMGFSWDLRAISEPYENDKHDIVVNLTSAHEYYTWLLTGAHPNPVPIGIWLLWTE
ncbi:hypothetical protein [Streptomyces justiciae]|uniref:hypothetical protein n=1 Tax=Streptomyces justiciae TaxID=2780140 RepID=UPI002117F252|nr:hypothetical protein [Streptomyces justiciae]MCW8383949.1 hypothetical protein [Streptomyces justiciae]